VTSAGPSSCRGHGGAVTVPGLRHVPVLVAVKECRGPDRILHVPESVGVDLDEAEGRPERPGDPPGLAGVDGVAVPVVGSDFLEQQMPLSRLALPLDAVLHDAGPLLPPVRLLTRRLEYHSKGKAVKEIAKDSSDTESSSSLSLGSTLEKKVVEWLTGQGYPLEMYTAKCCRDRGFAAYQSWYYFDREKQQQRVTDVYGHTRRVRVNKARDFQLSFTFECKQSRARPWVAFVHDNDGNSMSPMAAMAQRFVPEYAGHWWRSLTHKARKSIVVTTFNVANRHTPRTLIFQSACPPCLAVRELFESQRLGLRVLFSSCRR
jgi:hypothetical protein